MEIELIDSCTEGTATTYTLGYSTLYIMGQSFLGKDLILDKAKFKISGTNTPSSGYIQAVIYDNVTGTMGSNMRPIDDIPLVVSNVISLPSGLPSGIQKITLQFSESNKILLEQDKAYVLGLRYIKDTYDQYMSIQVLSSASHIGNYCAKKVNQNFTFIASVDLWFELYGYKNEQPTGKGSLKLQDIIGKRVLFNNVEYTKVVYENEVLWSKVTEPTPDFYIEYETSSGTQTQSFTTGALLRQFIMDNKTTFINHCKVVAKLPQITSCNNLFRYITCSSLDLSEFNTANVNDMYAMFTDSLPTTIDVSNFDTSKVTNMGWMFGNSKIVTIYCNDDWSNGIVSKSANMFSGCSSLVGAISYSSAKITLEYANPTTGYFTPTN